MKEAKWYFDTKAKGCRPFVYTGCEGNENLFDSAQECERACPNAFPPEIEVIAKVRQFELKVRPSYDEKTTMLRLHLATKFPNTETVRREHSRSRSR